MFDTSKWNMAPKYRRRRAVVFSAIAALVVVAVWQVAANLWWTSSGYCWGDYFQCMGY